MNTSDNDPLHAAINAGLADLVKVLAAKPAWYQGWMHLSPESTEEERLAVYQAVRDSGCLPAEAGFYLVSWQIDAMASQEAETALWEIEERMNAIERAYELEHGQPWPAGETPQEYEDLLRQDQAAWNRIFVEKLEEFGEHDMARQFLADPDGFQRRSKAGQEFFHGPQEPEESDAPEWLYALAETVAGNMTTFSSPGPLGFLYQEEEGVWEIVIYPKTVELVGGADDGEILTPGFSLDLEELRGEFERVDAVSWQSLGYPDGEGPHVSIEGVYQGHEVFVQVLAYAPENEEPGMKLDTTRHRP